MTKAWGPLKSGSKNANAIVEPYLNKMKLRELVNYIHIACFTRIGEKEVTSQSTPH